MSAKTDFNIGEIVHLVTFSGRHSVGRVENLSWVHVRLSNGDVASTTEDYRKCLSEPTQDEKRAYLIQEIDRLNNIVAETMKLIARSERQLELID